MASRARVTRCRDRVVKEYRTAADAAHELSWYRRLDGVGVTPKLLDTNGGAITIAYHPPAMVTAGYRPVWQLAELLLKLESLGISHRDIHPGNIVAGPDGPLLVDWETAVAAPGLSYDIHGPDVSGVPVPDIHAALPSNYRMWWGSAHRASIKNAWGAEFPSINGEIRAASLP